MVGTARPTFFGSARPSSPILVGTARPTSPVFIQTEQPQSRHVSTEVREYYEPRISAPAGVGITFEPDIGYGSSTYGMHVVTKIRPYSPAHKSNRVQVGDVLALIQQVGNEGDKGQAVAVAGMPIEKVLGLLTGMPGSTVILHILDGQFVYLPPKIITCVRENLPTGVTETLPETSEVLIGATGTTLSGSVVPMSGYGTTVPVPFGSAAPMTYNTVSRPIVGSAAPLAFGGGSAAPMYRSAAPMY